MVSPKVRILINNYVDKCLFLDRVIQAETDVFKHSKRKDRASAQCEQARDALWTYISELEAKAGVE